MTSEDLERCTENTINWVIDGFERQQLGLYDDAVGWRGTRQEWTEQVDRATAELRQKIEDSGLKNTPEHVLEVTNNLHNGDYANRDS